MNKKRLLTVFGGVKKTTVIITTPDDAYLNSTAATTNYVSSTTLLIRKGVRNAILKFDLSTIPSGSKIVKATLNLYCQAAPSENSTINVHPILVANNDMVFAEMTWNLKKTGTAWAGDTAGDGGADAGCSVSDTDYLATSIGSCLFTTTDSNGTKYTFNLTPSAIETLMANNYGLVLISSSVTATSTIHSQESVTEGYRPTLEIVYK